MNSCTKPVESLQVHDFVESPVWEFVNDDEMGETAVRPIETLPVEDLNGRVVGVQIRLANGNKAWASLGNVDSKDSRQSEHFLSLSVERDGQWFHLSRYHDFDYDENGPEALARFLSLTVDEVFPISYDISRYVNGEPAVLACKILKEPGERLTRSEIIAMAVQ